MTFTGPILIFLVMYIGAYITCGKMNIFAMLPRFVCCESIRVLYLGIASRSAILLAVLQFPNYLTGNVLRVECRNATDRKHSI